MRPMLHLCCLIAALLSMGASGAVFAQDQVLVGTDVVERSTFSVQQVSPNLNGEYVADQGGAVLTGKLVKNASGWKFERALTEPGSNPIVKTYLLESSGEGLHGLAGNIQIVPVNDAILVLELATDELVPSDLWILYGRKE